MPVTTMTDKDKQMQMGKMDGGMKGMQGQSPNGTPKGV